MMAGVQIFFYVLFSTLLGIYCRKGMFISPTFLSSLIINIGQTNRRKTNLVAYVPGSYKNIYETLRHLAS